MVFNEDAASQDLINVTSISRPKRVAFLVDLNNIDSDGINNIIRYCITVWGGRYHAIIPASFAEIKPSWWELLKNLDPDIIYSFLTLDEKLVWLINRHILPSKIIEPNERTKEADSYRISTFDIGALEITDIPLHAYQSQDAIYKQSYIYIKDSRENNPCNTFALRNLGAFPEVMNYTPESLLKNVPHKILDPSRMSPYEILKNILKKDDHYPRRIILPNDFCQMYASRNYSLEFDTNIKGFHLVVGDHPLDAIYAWNRSLNSDVLLGRDVFWLSTEQSQDNELLKILSQWIKETFWSDQRDTGKVISYSMERKALHEIADKMSHLVQFRFEPHKLSHDKFHCPKAHKNIPDRFQSDPCRLVDKVPISDSRGLVRFQPPSFFMKGHPQFGWMVDLEIQYHTSWSNIIPIWKLPKRLGLAQKFFPNSPNESRIVRESILSTSVTTITQNIHMRIPSDYSIIWTWLERYNNSLRKRNPDLPLSQSFRNLRTSDKGRYLQGLLRLFGNLHSAGYAFENPFWREIFLLMAGRPNFQRELDLRAKQAVGVLDDILDKYSPLEKGNDRVYQMAEELARRLTLRDYELKTLNKKELISNFAKLRYKALKKNSNHSYWNAYKKFDEDKERDLQHLLEDKVLLQGAHLSCPQCSSALWYLVDEIKTDMRCNGCLFNFPIKPYPEWSFRLNDLVTNALRKHGTLAVLQALNELQLFSDMFLFLPCQDIFKKENEEKPFTDLDIIVIKNAKLIIGEIKSDTGSFESSDLQKLKEVAIDLEPNEVLFAAPGESWPKETVKEMEQMSKDLAPLDIKVSRRLLKWR